MVSDYVVRQMRRDEARLAMDWAAAEGWNPGLYDAELFYDTDPAGFFLGALDGEPVACISGVAYDDTYGFIGLYIVAPEHRGKGYGLRIWEEAMAYLGQRNVGLDGVLAQQANYERSGFTLAYRNVRYELDHGLAVSPPGDPDLMLVGEHVGNGGGPFRLMLPASTELEWLDRIPFEELMRYDSRHFPVPRASFLRRWVTQPDGSGIALRRNGALAGFGLIRGCREGYKIGPLLADDLNTAEALFIALNDTTGGATPVYLDVPEPNAEAVRLAESYGMKPSFETVRMYSRGEPDVSLEKIFGVTTFELG